MLRLLLMVLGKVPPPLQPSPPIWFNWMNSAILVVSPTGNRSALTNIYDVERMQKGFTVGGWCNSLLFLLLLEIFLFGVESLLYYSSWEEYVNKGNPIFTKYTETDTDPKKESKFICLRVLLKQQKYYISLSRTTRDGKEKIGELQEVASCRTQRGPWVWKYSVADERKNFCKYKTLRVFLLQQQQQGPQFNGAKTRPKECGCIKMYWRSAFWFPAQAKVAEKRQQWQQESDITLPLVWECRNFLTTK